MATALAPELDCITCPDGHAGPLRPCASCGLLPPTPHRVWAAAGVPVTIGGSWALISVSTVWLRERGAASVCPACVARGLRDYMTANRGRLPAQYRVRQPARLAAPVPDAVPGEDDEDDDDDGEPRRR